MRKIKHGWTSRVVVCIFCFALSSAIASSKLFGQSESDSLKGSVSLNQCVGYAINHNPQVKQLNLQTRIVRNRVASALSGWLPQVELNANYQHYLLQPVSIFPDFSNPEGPKREVTTGVLNTSALQFNASQVIYDPDIVIAGTSARYFRKQSEQTKNLGMIDVVVRVSKAFYDVLLSEARLEFFIEDHSRVERTLKDASSLYESGLSDKIDYQRAQIALNNINAEIQAARQEIRVKYALLKEHMGYPADVPLSVESDSMSIEYAMLTDTNMMVEYRNRIEYKLLLTNIRLQQAEVTRNQLGFLPNLSVYGNYNLVYQNDDFDALYNRDFPNSSAGLRLTLPLFQGGRRLFQMKIARLSLQEMILDTVSLKSRIRSEFETAMASYKTNLKSLEVARQNASLAGGIFNTIRLQYNQGIKSFLEVIISEADLRTAKISELNAVYQLITSRLELDVAMGNISLNY